MLVTFIKMNVVRPAFFGTFTLINDTSSMKWCSYTLAKNVGSEVLELRIINHLYPCASQLYQISFETSASGLLEHPRNSKWLSPVNAFHNSLDTIRPDRRPKNEHLSSISEAALSQLTTASLSPDDHALLLVSAALITRRSCSILQPQILSGLSSSQDTVSTLRLLYVAGLVRLRLPPAVWRPVQRRLADRSSTLSEADLVCLSSGSFRCGAAITSSRLQQRLLAAARRLADGEAHTGSLVALLKALRLARVPCSPLLVSLRRLVLRRGDRLSLPAAAHLAACWCSPAVKDAPLLAALESTLRRRLEAASERPSEGSTVSLEFSSSPTDCSTSPVPDGRPKDVARLLFALSHLGHAPQHRTLELVERRIADWWPRWPLPLVDALLSLAILGRYPPLLLKTVLTEEVAQKVAAVARPRQLGRLALLHIAVSLETSLRPPPLDRVLAPAALPAPCLERELRRRPRLAPLLERLRRQQPAARATLGHPVPHLNSASVLLNWADGRRAAVELLDGDALLGRTAGLAGGGGDTADMSAGEIGDARQAGDMAGLDCAVGLIRLKARLAEKLGYTVRWELGLCDHCGPPDHSLE